MKKLYILLTIVLFPLLLIAQGVTKTGTTGAKFLSIGVGPRANALGGAFSSISDDVTALYWNPAGIAQITSSQAIFTYTKLFADINLNYVAAVIRMGDIGSFGFSVTNLAMGDMEVTTETFPEGTGEKFSAGSYAFGLSYGRYITEEFMVGVTVKYVLENIFNSSANGFAFDIGTIFTTPFYGIKFATSIMNYGTKLQMKGDDLLIRYDPDPQRSGNNQTIDAFLSTDKFEFPLRLQIGISKDFHFGEAYRFTLGVDATHPSDNAEWVNIGGELSLFKNLINIRGGYKSLFLKDSPEGLTFGMGLNYHPKSFLGFSVDYSFQEFEFLGNIHSFGIKIDY